MKRGGGGRRGGGGGGGKIRFEAVEDEEEEKANNAMALGDGDEGDDGDERMELDSSEEGAIDNEVSEKRGRKVLRSHWSPGV
jgi:hypothetical protein